MSNLWSQDEFLFTGRKRSPQKLPNAQTRAEKRVNNTSITINKIVRRLSNYELNLSLITHIRVLLEYFIKFLRT